MQNEILAFAEAFVEGRSHAERSLEFGDFVAGSYASGAVYTAAYGGVLDVTACGSAEILATHYGRDMSLGWEGWSWPCRGIFVGGGRRAVLHWVNLAPGRRDDGSAYETPGVSFLEFDSAGMITKQEDLMDLAAQLRLCDELEAAGHLAIELRESWVSPMKKMLVDAFF